MNWWLKFEPHSCLEGCQCEFVRDGLIRQPSSAWSSLFLLICVFFLYKKFKAKDSIFITWLCVISLLSFSSFLAHAGFVRFTLAMDFAAIFLVLSYFVIVKILPQRFLKLLFLFITVLIFYLISLSVMYLLPKWYKIGFSLILMSMAIFEVRSSIQISRMKSPQFIFSMGLLFISFVLFLLDEAHVGCHPVSLFQLHSLWHLGIAISLYLYSDWRFSTER